MVPVDEIDDELAATIPDPSCEDTVIDETGLRKTAEEKLTNRSRSRNAQKRLQANDLQDRVSILNESIQSMVEAELIGYETAYHFLSSKLDDLTMESA